LEQVKSYYKLRGRSTTNIPKLDQKFVNLYRLKKEVALRGGIQRVTGRKLWAEVARELGYVRKNWTRVPNTLKAAYQKVILPYETWYGKHKRDTGKKRMSLFHYYINHYTHFILFSTLLHSEWPKQWHYHRRREV
jgi:histone demethylase JARID1